MCYVAVIIYKIQIDCYQFSLVWFDFMMFNATFTIFQLYRGGQVYWWRQPKYPEKTTDLPPITDKLSNSLKLNLNNIHV